MRTVRDATFEILRRHGLTTIFANPGSTAVASLVDLPDDISSYWACTRVPWSAWPPAGPPRATLPRWSTCTPRPAWVTRSVRWPPRCTRSRPCGVRPTTARARCSWCWPTAATRSWTGSWSAMRTGRPWPAFPEVSVSGMALALDCPAVRVEHHADLLRVLDEVVPTLADRDEPRVVEVVVAADPTFEP